MEKHSDEVTAVGQRVPHALLPALGSSAHLNMAASLAGFKMSAHPIWSYKRFAVGRGRWLALALVAGGGGFAPAAPSPPGKPVLVFLFAGQSNMAGADAV